MAKDTAVGLSLEEQETIVIWNAGEKKWIGTSCLNRDINRMEASGWKEIKDGSVSLPFRRFENENRKAIVFRKSQGRIFTDEQRKAVSDRFKKIREDIQTKRESKVVTEALEKLETTPVGELSTFDDI
jgi:hypothetical protein